MAVSSSSTKFNPFLLYWIHQGLCWIQHASENTVAHPEYMNPWDPVERNDRQRTHTKEQPCCRYVRLSQEQPPCTRARAHAASRPNAPLQSPRNTLLRSRHSRVCAHTLNMICGRHMQPRCMYLQSTHSHTCAGMSDTLDDPRGQQACYCTIPPPLDVLLCQRHQYVQISPLSSNLNHFAHAYLQILAFRRKTELKTPRVSSQCCFVHVFRSDVNVGVSVLCRDCSGGYSSPASVLV